ncbi:MAG: sugar transporter [Hyphomicrobiales bacterium]|nr:sugar transporter [Hyphomicrobiales bacterium]
MKSTRSILRSVALATVTCVLLTACGPTGDPGGFSAVLPAPAADAGALGLQGAQYRISRQDTLDVAVYQVPDLNRTVEVDGAGMINLPLLGGVAAAGRTVRELERDIGGRLGARYVKSPQVSVSVKDAVGQRATIDGAVKKTGIIQVKGDMTLLRALAEAQGFTETADLSAVMVFRQTAQGKVVARFDAAAIRTGQAADPPIYGGDTIVVDESGGKLAWKQFRDALPVAGLFRVL